ncbi:YcnI family copper-binding membrane protein [Pseudolysinimonas sp.]|uniref:YcnI family copper-binding membrane protein n=1 Tax=Pseudolysinimonas sp. TaxID=2680009 RepID=UPI003F7EDDBE
MHTHVRRTLATTIALGAGALLAVAAPLAASAHVTLQGNTAAAGSYTLLTFKVPNEESTGATTDRLTISLPTDHPFVSASYVPVPGWTATVTREKLPKPIVNGDSTLTEAVTKITWTADAGQGIPQGALGLFQLSVGPVPSVGSIALPAEQTYSDGSVVSWSQKGADAEHPAPVLYVNDAPPAAAHSGSAPTATATPVTTTTTTSSSDVVARAFGVTGLVVGVVGLIVGIAGFRRRAAAGTDS